MSNLANLSMRLDAVRITLADLRQDRLAQSLGLKTDFTPEETARYIRKTGQSLCDLKAAIEAELRA